MRIVPALNEITAGYWRAARAHRLAIQTCMDCGARQHPPEPLCRACHGKALAFSPVSGQATLYAFTVVHHSVHPATANQVPYVLALVELAEGPRLVANIRDCPVEDLVVGMPLEAVYEDLSDEIALVHFRPSVQAANAQ
jgi:uncharacterized OB-fold protein